MSCKVVAKTKTEDLAKNLIIKLGAVKRYFLSL